MKPGLLFLAAITSISATAQTTPDPNIIKLNLSSLLVKNVSLQYERAVGRRTSLALGIRFQPEGSVPFQEFIKNRVDHPNVQVGEARMGNFALTPEFRFYFKENLRGIYLAPYLRYARYNGTAPVTYTGLGPVRTALFQGDISSFSAGLLFGNQFRLGEHWVLDWWILGGHIGTSNGQMDFEAALSPQEQEDLRNTLDEVDIPFFDIEHNIHANGGTVKAEGAWGGVRAFGFAVGFRF